MAAIVSQSVSPSGLVPAYTAASAGGDTINVPSGDERTFIHVKNASASAVTLTINAVSPAQAKIPGVGLVTTPAISVSIAAASERMIGPIAAAYIDALSNINLAYSAVTSVTVAGLRLPAQSY